MRLILRPSQWRNIHISRRLLWAFGLLMVAILIWFVGPLVAIAHWSPLIRWSARLFTIVLVGLVVLSFYFWRELRQRRQNAALVHDLGDAAVEEPSDDYSAEDIKAMQERAKTALDMLRSTRIGKDKEFVYELPWYLFIGPPGAGKTTALQNAGLKFPISQEETTAPLRGVGGTRNCEWWFTDQAVMIDTAGRYTLQDSHAAADAKAWRWRRRALPRPLLDYPLCHSAEQLQAHASVDGPIH